MSEEDFNSASLQFFAQYVMGPIYDMRDKLEEMDEKVTDHISRHQEEEAAKQARRERVGRTLKIVGGTLAAALPILAAILGKGL